MLLLQNVRLVAELTEGYGGCSADVLVKDGKIQAIAPAGSLAAQYPAAELLDCAGQTLLPGMFDLHMHLYFTQSNFAALALRSQNERIFDAIAYAKEMLSQGYTTIRDCGNPHYIGVALRDAINAGIVDGPRILTSGLCITPTAKGNDTFPGLYGEVNAPDEILALCRQECAQGVDFLKYMATGSVANLTGVPGQLVTTERELAAMQEAAESLHSYVAVHCHGIEGIKLCAKHGIRTIEHASMMDEAAAELILKNGGKTTLVPTLTPVVQMHRNVDCGENDPRIMAKIGEVYDHMPGIVTASRAGVLTGWGTDISLSYFKTHVGFEFDARREAGFTNIEMLRQATINSARILGLENELGTIKAGKRADLVLVNGKPDEDISAMFHRPAAVWKDGKRCV